jgi:hypothetical protein
MVEAVASGGVVLDLQVIRPDPVAESGGHVLCEIDGQPLFERADAATAAVDVLVDRRMLETEAADDHDVRKHYANGAELVADFVDKPRKLPEAAVPPLAALTQPCSVRERCRLRRLRVR